jgi:predicted RNA binding protein with dsRBD fold (UPF0201 family)
MEATKLQIVIKTPVNPTEDKKKVALCLHNIIDKPVIQEEDNYLVVRSEHQNILLTIRAKLGQQRIGETARMIFLRNSTSSTFEFYLNKQAAFAGRVNFVTNIDQEDYLGPITVTVTAEEVHTVIDWLAGSTSPPEEER